MRGAGKREAGVVTREAFDDDYLCEGIGGAAAVFFRKRDAEKTECTQLLDDVARKARGFIPLGSVRLDLAVGEGCESVADLALLAG
jgi:hypothetical protein